MVVRGDPAGSRRLIDGLRSFHAGWAWVAIAGNGLAGLGGLAAWRQPKLRGRWVWIATVLAEVALVVQVGTGALLVSGDRYAVPRFHMFYGFVGFISVGLAYSYRMAMRGRLEMFYGLVGLFLMGVAIRAVQVG